MKKWVNEYKKKKKSGLVRKCSYFIGNILVEVRHIFLLDYPLILSLLEPKGVRVFWKKKKKSGPNRRSLLNNSIDNTFGKGFLGCLNTKFRKKNSNNITQ